MTCDRCGVAPADRHRPRRPDAIVPDPGPPRGMRVRIGAIALVVGCLSVVGAFAGGPPEPWYRGEAPGHFDYYWPDRGGSTWRSQDAAGGAAGRYPADGLTRSVERPWRRTPGGGDGLAPSWAAPDPGARRANIGPGDPRLPGDAWSARPAEGGYGQMPTEPVPYGPDAAGGGGYRPPTTGWARSSDYRFRQPEPYDAPYSARPPAFGSDDFSEPPQSAHPRYRFRGDPAPGEGGGWGMDPRVSAFRFRPLSDQELERIQSASGYRPLGGAEGTPFYRPEGLDEGWRPRGGSTAGAPGPWPER